MKKLLKLFQAAISREYFKGVFQGSISRGYFTIFPYIKNINLKHLFIYFMHHIIAHDGKI